MASLLARVVREVAAGAPPADGAALRAEVGAMAMLAARDDRLGAPVLEFDVREAAHRFAADVERLFGTPPTVTVRSGGHAHRYEIFRVVLPRQAPARIAWLARELDVSDRRGAVAVWRAALLCAGWIPGARPVPVLGVACPTRRMAETLRAAAATLGVAVTLQRRGHYDRVLVTDPRDAVSLLRVLGATRSMSAWAEGAAA